MSTTIAGFKDKKIESRSKVEPTTVQYIGENRQGLDTVSQIAYTLIGLDAVEAGSTTSVIVATGHAAIVGDAIRFTSGTLNARIYFVQAVDTNSFTLSQTALGTPSPGDTFVILRPNILAVDNGGAITANLVGPLTVNQGTTPWVTTGPFPEFSPTGGQNVMPIAFKDLFGNAVIPTGLNAAGVNVLGIINVDLGLNIQKFSVSGEAYALTAATANTLATARYIQVNSNGDVSSDLTRQQPLLFAAINVSASGDNTIVAADATRRIKVVSYAFVCSSTVNVTWKSGAGTNLSGAMAFIANTGIAPGTSSPSQGPILQTAVNQALVLNLSGAVQVSGHMSYFLEA